MSQSVLPMFSAKSFIVSGLAFRSLIHFQFFFVWHQKVFQFHSFTCSCPVFPAAFVEETVFFPHCIFFPPLSQITRLYMHGCISGLCSVPLICMSVFVPVAYCFDDQLYKRAVSEMSTSHIFPQSVLGTITLVESAARDRG